MIRHIWILIAKKLNGSATAEELRELEKVSADAGGESPLELIEQIWKDNSDADATFDVELQQRWAKFQDLREAQNAEADDRQNRAKLHFGSWRIISLKFAGYAALFVLTMGLVYLLAFPAKTPSDVTTMIAPLRGVSKIILPDGSSVWLNSGSKISYKKNAETLCREVSLSGEAYFDVVKDPHHPFIVTTSTFKITVLGTAFNVRSYEKGRTAEAMLVRGRIELSLLKRPETKYILKPADKLTFKNTAERAEKPTHGEKQSDQDIDFSSVEVRKIHEYSVQGTPSEALWMKNVIDFDNAHFEDVAKMMEHKYNVVIRFKNEDISKIKFSGKFKNETLEEAMKELQEIIDFQYKVDKDEVMIF